MTEREELLQRLERVKALAERGVGGEKENAEALLNRLMAKYAFQKRTLKTPQSETTSSGITIFGRENSSYRLPTSILAAVTAAVRSAPNRDGRTRRYV